MRSESERETRGQAYVPDAQRGDTVRRRVWMYPLADSGNMPIDIDGVLRRAHDAYYIEVGEMDPADPDFKTDIREVADQCIARALRNTVQATQAAKAVWAQWMQDSSPGGGLDTLNNIAGLLYASAPDGAAADAGYGGGGLGMTDTGDNGTMFTDAPEDNGEWDGGMQKVAALRELEVAGEKQPQAAKSEDVKSGKGEKKKFEKYPYSDEEVIIATRILLDDDIKEICAIHAKSPNRERHQEFVKKLVPLVMAMCWQYETPPPSVILGQSAHETGWGENIGINNYFGIKADTSWKGKKGKFRTKEEVRGKKINIRADFRAYDSLADSAHDYVKFIHGRRYENALKADNWRDAIKAIAKAGYATESDYATLVGDIIIRYFKSLDKIERPNDREMKQAINMARKLKKVAKQKMGMGTELYAGDEADQETDIFEHLETEFNNELLKKGPIQEKKKINQ